MSFEKLKVWRKFYLGKKNVTRRVLHKLKCNCGYEEILTEAPPKEKQCPVCKTWNIFEQIEWTGPDKFGG